jgi:uncharacterized protein YydD (DUF2326 family)
MASSGVLLDTEEFSSYLRSEMVAIGMDATMLDRALHKARREADELTQSMEEDTTESFSLMREYLRAEEAETRELEKWIDNLSRPSPLLSDASIPVATFVSDAPALSDRAYEKYTSHIASTIALDK